MRDHLLCVPDARRGIVETFEQREVVRKASSPTSQELELQRAIEQRHVSERKRTAH